MPATRELPLEAQGQVGHDAEHGDAQGQRAVLVELGADRRPHRLGARQQQRLLAVGRGARRAADLLALRREVLLGAHGAGLGLAQRLEDPRRDLGLLDPGLHRQADQHVARGAELLHLHVAHAQAFDQAARAVDVGRLRVLDLDQRAAGELDRQVQALGGQEEHRRGEGDERDDVQHQRMAHERDVALDPEKLHRASPLRPWGQVNASPPSCPRGSAPAPTLQPRPPAARPGRSTPTSAASAARTRS